VPLSWLVGWLLLSCISAAVEVAETLGQKYLLLVGMLLL
jgi:hypothetical protein